MYYVSVDWERAGDLHVGHAWYLDEATKCVLDMPVDLPGPTIDGTISPSAVSTPGT